MASKPQRGAGGQLTKQPPQTAPSKRPPPGNHTTLRADSRSVANATQTSIVHREGPIPAPQELFEYDRLVPGAADRIIAMAEREQAHRINMEDLSSRADIRHRDEVVRSQQQVTRSTFMSDLVGQVLGWLVAVACIAGSVYTASIGADWRISVALVTLPLAAIIRAFRSSPKPKA